MRALKILAGIIICLFSIIGFLGAIFVLLRNNEGNLAKMNIYALPIMSGAYFIFGASLFKKKDYSDIDTVLYADAIRRTIAILIDGVLISAITIPLQVVLVRTNVWVFAVSNSISGLGIQSAIIFLIYRYGATPGKMITGIKVVDKGLGKVSAKQAFYRSSVDLLWGLLFLVVSLSVFGKIDFAQYQQLSFSQRGMLLINISPLFLVLSTIQQYWIWSEIIVLITNKKKRAIHDFIASTVVIVKKNLALVTNAPA